MKLKTKLSISLHSYGYFPIPEKDALKILKQFGKRVICIVDQKTTFHCAIQRNNTIGYFIQASKPIQKKTKLDFEDKCTLQIKKDNSEYQMAICEEMVEVLDTDPEGKALFQQLTDGKKRGLIHYVNTAKQMDTRINRALKIMQNLKLGFTKPQDLVR